MTARKTAWLGRTAHSIAGSMAFAALLVGAVAEAQAPPVTPPGSTFQPGPAVDSRTYSFDRFLRAPAAGPAVIGGPTGDASTAPPASYQPGPATDTRTYSFERVLGAPTADPTVVGGPVGNASTVPLASYQPGPAADTRTYSFDRVLGAAPTTELHPTLGPTPAPIEIAPPAAVPARALAPYFAEAYPLRIGRPIPATLGPIGTAGGIAPMVAAVAQPLAPPAGAALAKVGPARFAAVQTPGGRAQPPAGTAGGALTKATPGPVMAQPPLAAAGAQAEKAGPSRTAAVGSPATTIGQADAARRSAGLAAGLSAAAADVGTGRTGQGVERHDGRSAGDSQPAAGISRSRLSWRAVRVAGPAVAAARSETAGAALTGQRGSERSGSPLSAPDGNGVRGSSSQASTSRHTVWACKSRSSM